MMHRMVALGILIFAAVWVGACSGGERVLSAYLNSHQEMLEKPASVDSRPVRFEVAPGTPARAIGANLREAGLITDDLLFEAYVRINGVASQLEAGTFILSPSMTMLEIIEILQHAEASSITITIPEGWRLEQVAEYLDQAQIFEGTQAASAGQPITDTQPVSETQPLSETGVAASPETGVSYLTAASTGDLTGLDVTAYPFLQERPAGTSLEGYLFPDTYEVPAVAARPTDVLARQLDTFAARVIPAYEQALAAGTTDMDLYTVLTVASIVEREAVIPEERPAIAGVYLNRLAVGMRLEADPTVQYAMGYQPETGQWWKTPVFLEEYSSVISPYNTYLNDGLPPGPIASPGLSSIQAVLNPEDHNYLFFVATPDGTGRHIFAETWDEHVENVRQYQSGG